MVMDDRPYIVGNWKMNGTRAMLSEARAIDRTASRYTQVDVALAPPFTLIHAVNKEAGAIGVGAQDCHSEPDGARTGDVSAVMVKDAGAGFVILGHSERRQGHGESDADVKRKAEAALEAGLALIVCCGETLEEREAGRAQDVVLSQIRASLPDAEAVADSLTIAYEPVWAIGTGQTATPEDASEMHVAIRSLLLELFGKEAGAGIRILYGGSVKAENAAELLGADEIDGALVGGASLSVDDFGAIIVAAAGPPRD